MGVPSLSGRSGKDCGPETVQLRLDTLRVKIQSCLTFASLAQLKYELSDSDAERFPLDGYDEFLDVVVLFSRSVDLPPWAQKEVQAEIAQADERLREVEQFSGNLSGHLRGLEQTVLS